MQSWLIFKHFGVGGGGDQSLDSSLFGLVEQCNKLNTTELSGQSGPKDPNCARSQECQVELFAITQDETR